MKITTVWSLAFVTMMGCANDSDTTQQKAASEPPSADAAVVDSADPKAKVIAAKDALMDKLSTRLMQAMSTGGPAAAIEVCSKDAPRLAAEVGEEHGVQIGRTSFKLRNPKNAPPEWSTDLIQSRVAEPRFVDLPNGDFGALLPIKLKPQCMTCHGPVDQIDESVQAALTELYPDDQATGFQTDDLRGWFWVTVPAQ